MVQTDQDNHPFDTNPTSLRITVTPDSPVGAVRNPGEQPFRFVIL